MKINKLFHWLYAFLMFLPVFFVAGRTLYTIFNKNAKDSYYGETINEVEYNEVTSLSNYEKYHYKSNTYTSLFENNNNEFLMVRDIDNIYSSVASIQTLLENSSEATYIYFVNNGTTNPYLRFTDENLNVLNNVPIQSSVIEFDFYLLDYNNIQTDILALLSTITYNDYSYLDNAFEYSVNQINESPLFAWATDSFLAEPITYVTDLFNMPSTSPVITLFSYWLTISLCWLVFDLVMYVPLLAHRWLDKGGIS